jgi:hypothetical protein
LIAGMILVLLVALLLASSADAASLKNVLVVPAAAGFLT